METLRLSEGQKKKKGKAAKHGKYIQDLSSHACSPSKQGIQFSIVVGPDKCIKETHAGDTGFSKRKRRRKIKSLVPCHMPPVTKPTAAATHPYINAPTACI